MERKSPGPTNQTHPNGLGQTGSVEPAPRLTLTIIPSPVLATGSRPHRRCRNPACSGGFRRRRMAQTLCRHLLYQLTMGNHVLQLHSLPPSWTRPRCRGGPSCARDLLAPAESISSLVTRWPGLRLQPPRPSASVTRHGEGTPAGAAGAAGTVVPLCCHAAVPSAIAFSLVTGKYLPLPSSTFCCSVSRKWCLWIYAWPPYRGAAIQCPNPSLLWKCDERLA
jgi:hypothetical protein